MPQIELGSHCYELPPKESFFIPQKVNIEEKEDWDAPLIPLLKELAWVKKEFEEGADEDNKVRTYYGHLVRHFGPLSPHSAKAAAIEELYTISLILRDQYSDLRISESEKTSIRDRLHEDIAVCTHGYHNRIMNILKQLSLPKGIKGLLYRFREHLVERCVRRLSSDIHDHNRFFSAAFDYGFGVYPINRDDPFPGNFQKSNIFDHLQQFFLHEYRPFAIVQAIQEKLDFVLREKYGYCGRREQGYLPSDLDQFSELFGFYFSDFSLSESGIMNEMGRLVDLDWVKINKKIWAKLNEDGYFLWNAALQKKFNAILTKNELEVEAKEDIFSDLCPELNDLFSSAKEYLIFIELFFSEANQKVQLLRHIFFCYSSFLEDDVRPTLNGILKNQGSLPPLNTWPPDRINLLYPSFIAAIKAGEFTLVQALADLIPESSRTSEVEEWKSAFFTAVIYGKNSIIAEFLRRGFDLETQNENQQTALFLALNLKLEETVIFLVQQGAMLETDVPFIDNILFLSIRKDLKKVFHFLMQQEITQTLLEKQDRAGCTPLLAAVLYQRFDYIEPLLSRGANLHAVQKITEKTVLMLAMSANISMFVVTLLLRRGASVEGYDYGGRTAISLAASFGSIPLLECLLQEAPNCNSLAPHKRSKLKPNVCAFLDQFQSKEEELIQKLCEPALLEKAIYSPKKWKQKMAFFAAARLGRIDLLKQALQLGVDPNTRGLAGLDAFSIALEAKQLAAAQFLLESGALPWREIEPLGTQAAEMVKTFNKNMLDFSRKIRHGEISLQSFEDAPRWMQRAALIATFSQAKIHLLKELIEEKGSSYYTENECLILFMYAVTQGSYEVVKFFLQGPYCSFLLNHIKMALINAARFGHDQLVILIFEECKKHKRTISRSTSGQALVEAASLGHLEVIKKLLDPLLSSNHADLSYKMKGQGNALYCAVMNRHDQVIEFLLDRAFVCSMQDDFYRDVLPLLAAQGCLDAVHSFKRFLMSEERNEFWTQEGVDALSEAVLANQLSITLILLRYFPGSKIIDPEDNTLLALAVSRGHLDLTRVLLRHSKLTLNISNQRGDTPLLIAARHGNFPLVKLLLQEGADVNKENHQHSTPLSVAIAAGHLRVVQYLIAHSADPVIRGQDGQIYSEFLFAILHDQLPLVRYFWEIGYTLDEYSSLDMSPLMLAVHHASYEMVLFLLDRNVDIDAQDSLGRTALFYAALRGDLSIVELLIRRGAEPELSFSGNQMTPLAAAHDVGNTEVVEFLQNKGAVSKGGRQENTANTAFIAALRKGHYALAAVIFDKMSFEAREQSYVFIHRIKKRCLKQNACWEYFKKHFAKGVVLAQEQAKVCDHYLERLDQATTPVISLVPLKQEAKVPEGALTQNSIFERKKIRQYSVSLMNQGKRLSVTTV